MRPVKVIRIDPVRRAVAALTLKPAKEATPQLLRIMRAKTINSRRLMSTDAGDLIVVSALDIDESVPMWRFPGTEDTAGIGVLTGINPENRRLVHAPVSVEWVRERIQWIEGEKPGEREERARELLPMLNDEVRAAVSSAFPTAAGDMWISADHKARVGQPLVTLGLGTERSEGQMLTALGVAVHDILVSA